LLLLLRWLGDKYCGDRERVRGGRGSLLLLERLVRRCYYYCGGGGGGIVGRNYGVGLLLEVVGFVGTSTIIEFALFLQVVLEGEPAGFLLFFKEGFREHFRLTIILL
jgi:hypothetical protein